MDENSTPFGLMRKGKNILYSVLVIASLVICLNACSPKTMEKDGGLVVKLSSTSAINQKTVNNLQKRFQSYTNHNCITTSTSSTVEFNIPGYYKDSLPSHLYSKTELSFKKTILPEEYHKSIDKLNQYLLGTGYFYKNKQNLTYRDSLGLYGLSVRNHLGYPTIEFGNVTSEDSEELLRILNQNSEFFPKGLEFKYGLPQTIATDTFYSLIAVKNSREPIITQAMIDTFTLSRNEVGTDINFELSPPYHNRWSEFTRLNIGKPVSILINDQIYSSPTIMSEITGGNCSISANWDINEAKALVLALNNPINQDIFLESSLIIKPQNK